MVGSQEISLFNGPASVAYFREPSQQLTAKLANDYVEIVENRSCSLGVAECRLSSPYPSLQMSNLRYESSVNLYWEEAGQKEYIYIADTQNHCIKRLSLTDSEVSTVAGKCGSSGFKDGPLGYNRLNTPTNLGVSRQGVLYFFDSGNEYIRLLDGSGKVSTMLLGACKQCKGLIMQMASKEWWPDMLSNRYYAMRIGLRARHRVRSITTLTLRSSASAAANLHSVRFEAEISSYCQLHHCYSLLIRLSFLLLCLPMHSNDAKPQLVPSSLSLLKCRRHHSCFC